MTAQIPPTTAVRDWQVALTIAGLALLGVGGVTILNDVPLANYLGIATWLLGALVIHDGIIALAVFGASVLLRKATRRVPFVVVAVVQGALVIAGIVTIIVVPEIIKRAIGTANPSILPLDYSANLVSFYGVLAAVAVVAVVVCLIIVRARRPKESH